VPSRDPYAVLGVDPGDSLLTIKAAWRRLARENHPDVVSADPATVDRATRRMAEINAAYAEVRAGRGRGPGPASPRFDRETAGAASGGGAAAGGERRRGGGPPPPPRTRPVTGHVDTSTTFRPRNATVSGDGPILRGVRSAARSGRSERPLRASSPTGPVERGRVRDFRRIRRPPLEAARQHVVEFGKFHGHTLGEIGAFEPSYIDWLARTISRDPELVAAARVVQDDLDRRGVVRRDRTPSGQEHRSAV
jgi:curved DNA-binding protein CbpA